MVAYYSSLLLHCYILLVTELFSFPVPGQSWNRLWMCVGQGEGKLRVTVSLHSGAFSFSIKLAAFRLPVGLAFFSLVYYFQRRECIWQSENSTSLNTDGRDYTTLSPDLQKPAVSFQGFSSLTGGLAFVNYFHLCIFFIMINYLCFSLCLKITAKQVPNRKTETVSLTYSRFCCPRVLWSAGTFNSQWRNTAQLLFNIIVSRLVGRFWPVHKVKDTPSSHRSSFRGLYLKYIIFWASYKWPKH